MMTAKQCYDFLHSKQYYGIVDALKLKGVTINLDNSFLKGWWEGDIKQSNSVNNCDSIKTKLTDINETTEKERENQLHSFIWRVYLSLKNNQNSKPKAQAVWNEIRYHYEKHDIDNIIQEVTSEKILWCSRYNNEQELKRTTFDKTLSNIKKNPPF